MTEQRCSLDSRILGDRNGVLMRRHKSIISKGGWPSHFLLKCIKRKKRPKEIRENANSQVNTHSPEDKERTVYDSPGWAGRYDGAPLAFSGS